MCQMFSLIPREIVYCEILSYLSFTELQLLLPTTDLLVQDAFRKYVARNSGNWKFYEQLENANNPDLYKIFFEMRNQISRISSSDQTKIDPKYISEYDAVLYNLIVTFSDNGMRYYFIVHQGPLIFYTNIQNDPKLAWEMSINECYILENAISNDRELLRYITDISPDFIKENPDLILAYSTNGDSNHPIPIVEIDTSRWDRLYHE